MDAKIVYLMRGLPSCGKSTTARKLAGPDGVICETDRFFYTEVGTDPTKYDYDAARLPEARQWNFDNFCRAVDRGASPIVVDRGNGLTIESHRYARYAADRAYRVELAFPESPWWNEIAVLLKYKPHTLPPLYAWAQKLSNMSRHHHRVPVATIRNWMEKWQPDVTIEHILHYPAQAAAHAQSKAGSAGGE